MENDPSTASLLQFFTTLLTLVILRLWQSCVRMFLFLALMNPLVPISRGMLRHLKSFPWIVVVSSLYISAFLDVAASMLADVFQCTMSSTSLTSWLLVDDDQARLLWRHGHVVNKCIFLYFVFLFSPANKVNFTFFSRWKGVTAFQLNASPTINNFQHFQLFHNFQHFLTDVPPCAAQGPGVKCLYTICPTICTPTPQLDYLANLWEKVWRKHSNGWDITVQINIRSCFYSF